MGSVATISLTSPSIRPLTATIGDPEGTRTVTSVVALLVALGLAMVMLAVWLFRRTRPDPELLAPLEAMGERSWRRHDPVWQKRRLDELRPPGARPLEPSAAPPAVDEAFDRGPAAAGFDDLREHVIPPEGAPVSVNGQEQADPTPSDQDAAQLPPPQVPDGAPLPAPPAGAEAVEVAAEPAAPVPAASAVPVDDDELFADLLQKDIDPDLLAAAMADLDAELRGWSDPAGPG